MENKDKVAILIGGIAGIGTLAYLYFTSKNQPGTELTLTADNSVINEGQSVDFIATLKDNNVPVPNRLVNLSTPGMNYTQETAADGTADFKIQFNVPGTYTIYATE